ncbi:MAG: RecB-like helicase [Campylobacterota bacterium]|nr:RecB-like helicase [Campylobacterota bacterium]
MENFLALKASAGSGKTFALTVRYISLLLLDAKPKEILTLTFTNKAAAQMADRIYKTLIALGSDENIMDAIVEQTGFRKQEILKRKDSLVKRFITDELAIYTIDKFVNKILREFSGYIGVNDDFEIKFDDEELLIYKFLISLDEEQFDTLISFSYSENKKLNSIVELFKILIDKNEKLEVVEYPYESLIAVKVAILEEANIIKEFIDKSSVSASGYKAVDFNDIDSLLDKGKTWLTKDSLSEFTYFKKAKPPLELDETLAKLKEHITLYYQIQESFTLKNLYKLFDEFKSFRDRYNKQRNSLEFSDITNIVYKLMKGHIDKDFLYFRLDSRYNHILIDEFQDTSTLQFKILYYLIDEIISGDPEIFKTFFYVGDIKQSIYRFRGGTKELFDHVAKVFSPMLKMQLLDTNYRSSKNVVNFVNDTFLQVPNYPYDPQKVISSKEGYVEVVSTSNEALEVYEDIYLQVDKLLKAGIDPSNIAILTYTNGDVLGIYEHLKQKLPKLQIVTEMTSKLINQTNVKALINGVKYLYFDEDIYKTNFNAILGRDYFAPFEFTADIKNTDIVKLVKNIAYTYNIVDPNVIKFIELCKEYSSIVDFVFDIDKSDASMISTSQKGLQILTVFKSKGLEFDTVIVCDRITKKNPDRSSLLFEYDDIELQRVFYKRSKRENLDRFYNEALDKEKALVVGDELNILYVALTRAEHNMIILKKEKSSVFDNLGDFPLRTLGSLYLSPKKQTKDDIKESIQYTPLKLGYQDKTKGEEKQSNLKARYFGTAAHYCLEMMKEFSKQSLETAMISTINKYGNFLTTKELDDIEGRIEILIGDEVFKELTKDANCIKEQSIVYKNEHKIIDLLVEKNGGYVVVDYKTSSQVSESNKEQVGYYITALKEILGSDKIFGLLVYMHKDGVEYKEVLG